MDIVALRRLAEKRRELEAGARYAVDVLRNCFVEGSTSDMLVAAEIPHEADKCN